MRVATIVLFVSLTFLASVELKSQQTSVAVQRDPQAIALLQQTVAAMTSSVPADSSATGTVTIVEGSTTQNGSIQILTRGTSQTAETVTLQDGQRAVVYSNGDAKEINGASSSSPPLELIVTDQCPDFPLPLLLSSLSTADEAIHYVGAETLDSQPVQHIQVWNTFSSNPVLKNIAHFSTKDIWLDAISGLPLKIAYSRRPGSGAVPAIPVEVTYSNYTKVNGVLYPFQIDKSLNGTTWMTITISIVSFNTGLTASHFQVE
ncbi:MAG: hypothetical protein WCE61_05460 [Candidatus Acidiferrum sp.]